MTLAMGVRLVLVPRSKVFLSSRGSQPQMYVPLLWCFTRSWIRILPLSVGSDMLKSLRTYVGAVLIAGYYLLPRAVSMATLN